jgi:shikimate kinase
MSLTEIISNHGVEYFNDAEIRAAKSIKAAGLIVATGGSMVLQAESMTYLRSTGKVIFLDVDSSQLEIRLGPDRLERIIGLNEGGLAGLQERRRPFYESTCDVAIKLNGNDAEEDLIEYCEENIDEFSTGSIFSNQLFTCLQEGLSSLNDFYSLGFTQLDASQAEQETIIKIIESAPAKEPVKSDYPNSFAYLKARMAWDSAIKHAEQARIKNESSNGDL